MTASEDGVPGLLRPRSAQNSQCRCTHADTRGHSFGGRGSGHTINPEPEEAGAARTSASAWVITALGYGSRQILLCSFECCPVAIFIDTSHDCPASAQHRLFTFQPQGSGIPGALFAFRLTHQLTPGRKPDHRFPVSSRRCRRNHQSGITLQAEEKRGKLGLTTMRHTRQTIVNFQRWRLSVRES